MGKKKNRTIITLSGDAWQYFPPEVREKLVGAVMERRKAERKQLANEWKREQEQLKELKGDK